MKKTTTIKGFMLLAATMLAVSCSNEIAVGNDYELKSEGTERSALPVTKSDPWSDDAPDPDESAFYSDYTRVPIQSKITEVQPMTGLVYWTTNGSHRDSRAIQLEFSYLEYRDVVKGRGVYDWSVVENLLNQVASRGHQMVLRFYYTYPAKASGVPDYIKQESDYEALWGICEGQNTEFPDWRCAELKRFHLEFNQKFAERYDKDPRLAFFQTGFGLWAEYHIYDGPRIIGQTFPSKDFQEEFYRVMERSFDDLSWSISKDAASSTYTHFAAKPALKEIEFGIFDDSFMHETHSGYNTNCWNQFHRNRYKVAPAGGELSYYTAYDQEHALDVGGMYGRTFESQADEFHISYMIANNQPAHQTEARLTDVSLSMGYKFTVLDFKVKGGRSAVRVRNTGVAPIYRDAYVAVNGVRSSKSLRGLNPGKSEWFEINSGGSNPTLTIECDHLVAGQRIDFEANVVDRGPELDIVIDGNFGDWADYPVTVYGTGALTEAKYYSNGTDLFLYYKGRVSELGFNDWRVIQMFFDSDNNNRTGLSMSYALGAGAEGIDNMSECVIATAGSIVNPMGKWSGASPYEKYVQGESWFVSIPGTEAITGDNITNCIHGVGAVNGSNYELEIHIKMNRLPWTLQSPFGISARVSSHIIPVYEWHWN